MMSIVGLSVEYLHSSSCKHLLPLNVVSFTSCPCDFFLYPMALIMFVLWCLSYVCSRVMGILVGGSVVALWSCSLSWPVSKAYR
jgi:hypothetical protein